MAKLISGNRQKLTERIRHKAKTLRKSWNRVLEESIFTGLELEILLERQHAFMHKVLEVLLQKSLVKGSARILLKAAAPTSKFEM